MQINPDWIERHPIIGKGLGGALLLCIGIAIGSGYLNTTKIRQIEADRDHTVGVTQAHANHVIANVLGKVTSGKASAPTTVPNCVPVTPPAIESR